MMQAAEASAGIGLDWGDQLLDAFAAEVAGDPARRAFLRTLDHSLRLVNSRWAGGTGRT